MNMASSMMKMMKNENKKVPKFDNALFVL